MHKLVGLAVAALALPAALAAQKAPAHAAAPAKPAAKPAATIDPGMSRSQVVAALGQPYSSRSRGSFTYLLYKNGCQKTCGMDDLVVLDSDKVVDAVFRSTSRRYSGTSSSPRMIPADEAAKIGGDSAAAPAKPRKVAKAKATDVPTPSKPVNPPKVKVAPAVTTPKVAKDGKDTKAPAAPASKVPAKLPAKSDSNAKAKTAAPPPKPAPKKPGA